MTAVETTQYLRLVSELEASVHCQEQMIETAKREMDSKKYQPKLKSLPAPTKSTYRKPTSPTDKNGAIITESSIEAKEQTNRILFYGSWGVVVVLGLFGIFLHAFIPMLVGGLIFPAAYYLTKRNLSDTLEEDKHKLIQYQEEMRKYNERVEAEEESFARKTEEYKANQLAVQKEYDESRIKNEQRRELVKSRISKMKQSLAETRATLKRVYSLDIVFPKYRNLVAMCSIYEYFAAGRCSELTGANGAYNLYESELRQNIIIGQLDQIIDQLEQIKQNQYMLYSELKQTNTTLKEVSRDVSSIMKATKAIEENSYLTAQYAKITAKNAEAIKYINLVN